MNSEHLFSFDLKIELSVSNYSKIHFVSGNDSLVRERQDHFKSNANSTKCDQNWWTRKGFGINHSKTLLFSFTKRQKYLLKALIIMEYIFQRS